MKTKENNILKKYISPEIERIQLDNEISLALESNAPFGPNEVVMNKTPEYFNNDPFRSNNI